MGCITVQRAIVIPARVRSTSPPGWYTDVLQWRLKVLGPPKWGRFDLELCWRGRSSPTDLLTVVSDCSHPERLPVALNLGELERVLALEPSSEERGTALEPNHVQPLLETVDPSVPVEQQQELAISCIAFPMCFRWGKMNLAARLSSSTVWTPATVVRSDNSFDATRIGTSRPSTTRLRRFSAKA